MVPGRSGGTLEARGGRGNALPGGRQMEGMNSRGEFGRRLEGAAAGGDEQFEFVELLGDGGEAGAIVPIHDPFGGIAAADEQDARGAGGGAGLAGDVEEEAALRRRCGKAGAGNAEGAQPGGALVERGSLVAFVGHGAGDDERHFGGEREGGFGHGEMRARGRIPGSGEQGEGTAAGVAAPEEFHAIIVSDMKIVKVEAQAISIPLPTPVADAVRLITHRDHLLVKVETDEGVSGMGFALGYDSSVAMMALIDAIYRPILVGAAAFATEHLWAEMYRQSIQAGRRGAALRAISAIDLALWDLRGKALGRPVMDLLGVYQTRLRCYATGGYYRDGQTVEDLVKEAGGVFEQGFTAIKLKVGKLSAAEDAARVGAVRRAFGEGVDILLDANGGWKSAPEAIAALRRLEEFAPYWIEEPVRADNLRAMAAIAEAVAMPVATGELEATRWAFAELVERKAAAVLQPDATVCGGASEWLKIAHYAAALDIPVAPHYHWDYHTQLCAAVPNAIFIEYFLASSGVKMFDSIVANPLKPRDGWIEPRREPGFGIELIEEEVARYRIA